MHRTPLAVVLMAFMLVVSVVAASCGGGQTGGGALTAALSHDPPVSSLVGAEGGTVATQGGTSVVIPAGALAGAQTVTIALSTSSTGPSDAIAVGPRYTFGPDGVTFAKPVTVTLAYDPARMGKGPTEPAVYMAPHGSSAFTALPTKRVDASHVAATTTHFTDFVTAYMAPSGSQVLSDANTKHLVPCPDPGNPSSCHDGFCVKGSCYQPVVPASPVPGDLHEPHSGDFCQQFRMSYELASHPKSRLGRVHYDEHCTKRPTLCVSSPPIVVSEQPKGCVEVQVVGGENGGWTVPDPANNALQCVDCPTREDKRALLPKDGQALCSEKAVELARNDTAIFNINGYDAEWMQQEFLEAGKTLRKVVEGQATCKSPCRSRWSNECVRCLEQLPFIDKDSAINGLTRIVRTLALELNYCTPDAGPWGLPSPYPSYPRTDPPRDPGTDPKAWRFKDKRAELNNMHFDKDLITVNDSGALAGATCGSAGRPCCASPKPPCSAMEPGYDPEGSPLTCQSGVCLPPPCPGAAAAPVAATPTGASPPMGNCGHANCSPDQVCLPDTDISDGSPSATVVTDDGVFLKIGFSAFTTQTNSCFSFSLDQLALILIHETRHMGTPSYGNGDPDARDVEVQSTEHYLNELEDYEEMFRHPYFIGSGADMAKLHNDFDFGRDLNYKCVQATWGQAGPLPGYPDDTQPGTVPFAGPPSVGGALPGIGGFGPLVMMPPGMGVLLQVEARRPPMPFKPLTTDAEAGACFLNGVKKEMCSNGPGSPPRKYPHVMNNPKDRCAVAKWAQANPWMASKMVRSMRPQVDSPREYQGQPWNTLAHYVLALPFRNQVYKECLSQ